MPFSAKSKPAITPFKASVKQLYVTVSYHVAKTVQSADTSYHLHQQLGQNQEVRQHTIMVQHLDNVNAQRFQDGMLYKQQTIYCANFEDSTQCMVNSTKCFLQC
jgi:hypothetical protein